MLSQKHIILLKNNLCKIGGLEKNTLKIADGFSKKGLEVTFLTDNPPNKSLGIGSVLLPKSKGPSFSRILQYNYQCNKWLKHYKPQLIFGFERNSYQTHYRAGNGCHISYLQSRKFTDSFLKSCSFSANPLHRTILSLEKKAFENAKLQRLFTNSHMVKNQILENYDIDESKISVIHNGVEFSDSICIDDREDLLKKYSINPYHHIFLFIGNNYRRKGLDLILQAMRGLKDTSLIVVGKDKYIDAYKQKAAKLNLSNNSYFLGPQKKVTDFYTIADTLLIPSFYDPFANVTLEALSKGLFVISSNQNGASEILTPEIGITLNNFPDIEELRYSLKIAMQKPKTLYTAVNIRDKVRHLDFSRQIETLVEETIKSS